MRLTPLLQTKINALNCCEMNTATYSYDDEQPLSDAEVIADYENHVNPAFAALVKFGGFDSVEVSARGCIVTDSKGRELLDCAGGIGSLSVGYSHPHVIEAVKRQLDKMAFSTRLLFKRAAGAFSQEIGQTYARRLAVLLFLQQRHRGD